MDVYQRRRLVALSILAGVFIIVVLLVRSCGDDEEAPVAPLGATGAGGPTTLSQSDFIDQADATCLESNTAFASVDESDPTLAATEEGQILASELDSLQTLPPPTEGTDELQRFLSALQEQVAAYDRYITALDRGDDTAAAELEAEIDKAAGKVQRNAGRFGFEVCGDPSQVGESTGGGGGGGGGGDAGTESAEAPAETPVEPAPAAPTETVEPAPAAPETTPVAPAEGGGATPEPAPAPPTDDSSSGGVTP